MAAPAQLRRPLRAVRRVGVLAHSSPRTRRLLPVVAAFKLAEAYAAWGRRRRVARWEGFRRFHEQLLEHTPLAGSEEDVAERALAELFRCVEVFWRPWLMERGELEGVEHYQAARSEGRGVVAVFPHFGIPYAQFPILRRAGIEAFIVAAAHHFADIGEGYDGRFARQGRAYVERLGPGHAIVRGDAFDKGLELLRDGATVSVAFDVTGSTPTPFVGRRLSLASGATRFAREADAMVAPFVVRRVGHHPVMVFAPPLDPRDHQDAVGLQAAIARVMERWALELPEAVWSLEQQPGGPPLIQGPALEAESART